MTRRLSILAVLMMFAALTAANATVAVGGLFSNHTVLQRDKPCPIWGTAAASKTITVVFNGQTKTTTSDSVGDWRLSLDAMAAKAASGNMTITESGANTITVTDVVVGDVWMCGGQSNMAWNLSGSDYGGAIAAANYSGIRWMWVGTGGPFVVADPWRNITSTWTVCAPSSISGFSAVAFYFARKIYLDQSSNIPIGLIGNSVGGTCIDPWLIQEGCTDIPVLAPLYSQSVVPSGPFCLANSLTHPVSPFGIKGLIWYQGENRETTSQSTDSYFLKEKGLSQGFKRLFGLDDFAMYIVLLANLNPPPSGANVAPDMPGNHWADTRIQQVNVVGIPHAGVASAMDVGDAGNIHPADKLDVGERLALWALRNDYGRTTVVPSGPILNNVTVVGNKATCNFDYVGSGLIVGYKAIYTATQTLAGGVLKRFSIAGATGSWYDATATIVGNTVELTSPSVSAPKKVAYACWDNPKDGLDPVTLKEGLLYNVEGLPANPFYVDDTSAKYTVTASAGANGSISPAGVTTYLKRTAVFYTITPNSGYYIADVTVDGASVGSVKSYTFDPLYANHTISATFVPKAFGTPSYTITASATTGGGTVSPTGAISVNQGGAQTFSITPNSGNMVTLLVDGQPMGVRKSFTFSDVRVNHTLSAAFTCVLNSQAGYGGTISPNGTVLANYGANQTFTISPIAGFSVSKVMVDGANVGAVTSYTFSNLASSHTITASFAGPTGGGSVPQQSQIIFSCLTDALPASGAISSWSTYLPAGQSLAAMGSPTVEVIDTRKFEKNSNVTGDGFRYGGSYSSSIACTGASIVAVAKPIRYGTGDNWESVVDVFYDRLVLGILNSSGKICVRRNGSLEYSATVIPEGQTTILSLVVQSNGTYKVYANGVEAMSNSATSDMTALVPGVTGGAGGYGTYMNVGRNNPDGWTTYNGYIGDAFLYKTALSPSDRALLENYIANRLLGTTGATYTITASAGANGTISPSGAVAVNQGANQTFAIAPSAGYAISQVTVDSVNQGAIATYTFSNVQASHTISAAFVALPTYTITASAGANGTISPNGAVSVTQGNNQTFTFTADTGYLVDQVTIDGGAPVAAGASYTFTNVTANGHTIAITFKPAPTFTITASSDANGTISPTGAVIVTHGNNQTFTMTANTGYRVSRVLVDGANVGAVTTYTFSNVIVAHTISAEFISTDFAAYWKFDETSGASAYDWSGNGKNGTLTNSPTWTAGLIHNAVNIPGGTSYVSVPSGIVLGLINFSISTWVKLTTVATNMR
ncbi:MAG: hypothetical protein NT018_12720, partial [Armatimonadetes bacterium]|nr:hypothetical protein [Armatimonadota bacterium]